MPCAQMKVRGQLLGVVFLLTLLMQGLSWCSTVQHTPESPPLSIWTLFPPAVSIVGMLELQVYATMGSHRLVLLAQDGYSLSILLVPDVL